MNIVKRSLLFGICSIVVLNLSSCGKSASETGVVKRSLNTNHTEKEMGTDIEEETKTAEENRRLVIADVGTFTGDIKKGVPEGKGTMVYKSGNKYVGEWKSGKRDGTGTMTFNNGAKYTGSWANGKENGDGTKLYSKDSASEKYLGSWKNGHEDGKGKMTYKGGATYTGSWINGKHNGKGFFVSQSTFYLDSARSKMFFMVAGTYKNGNLDTGNGLYKIESLEDKRFIGFSGAWSNGLANNTKEIKGRLFHTLYNNVIKVFMDGKDIMKLGTFKDGKFVATISGKEVSIDFFNGKWSDREFVDTNGDRYKIELPK